MFEPLVLAREASRFIRLQSGARLRVLVAGTRPDLPCGLNVWSHVVLMPLSRSSCRVEIYLRRLTMAKSIFPWRARTPSGEVHSVVQSSLWRLGLHFCFVGRGRVTFVD